MSAPLLPLFVKLEGRACLVAGAGVIGLQKVRSLLECAANVTIVAPDAHPEIQAMAKEGRVVWHQRSYAAEDLQGKQLVIAATNDAEVNHSIYRDATAAGVLANVVDDPPFCDFYFGSVVRRGPLQIGISTAGESPALAQLLRQRLEGMLDEDTGPWLEWLGALRREVLRTHPAGEARNDLLRSLITREVCDSPSCQSRLMTAQQPAVEKGSWWLT